MHRNVAKVLSAFRVGKACKSGAISTDGKSVFSYDMKIAYRLPSGMLCLLSSELAPSKTSRMHMKACHKVFFEEP